MDACPNKKARENEAVDAIMAADARWKTRLPRMFEEQFEEPEIGTCPNKRARENVAADAQRQTRFQAHGPADATLDHAAIYAMAANFPLSRVMYPAVSTFTPCFTTPFYYLHKMDDLMASTKCWTDSCMGWVPPCSQIYIGILLYIQTVRAMEAAGSLPFSSGSSDLSALLTDFRNCFPLQNLWIPGPLVPAFKSVSSFWPSATDKFGKVTPTLPATPGWSRARRYRMDDGVTTHLPNISLFISRMNSVSAAAVRSNTDYGLFLNDTDGPSSLASLFGQPCDHSANEQANLTSPGACLIYPGSLELWQNAHTQLQFLDIPQPLDVNADDVTNNWSTFLRFSNEASWFGSIAAIMARYCRFWKGSLPLYDCSASGSAAGAVRCTARRTNVFTAPDWTEKTGHYIMRPHLNLSFRAATSIEDIPRPDILAALTYNVYLSPNEAGHAVLRRGQFWNIHPDAYVGSDIRIYPGIFTTIARDYHSHFPIDSKHEEP